MNTGQYISGAGHIALILWALIGGIFLRADEADELPAAEVTLMTGEEFAALTAPTLAPTPGLEAPTPEAPTADAAPELTPEETPPEQAAPAPPEPEVPDTTPAPPALDTPQAEVTPEVPPSPEPPAPEAGDVVAPIPSDTPVPRPAPRVAPEPVTVPDPAPQIAEQPVPQTAPDAESEQVAAPEPPAAPEEATTEIVTEAEKPAGMTSSPRPRARPTRPTPPPTQQAEATPEAPAEPAQSAEQSPAGVANDIAAAIGGGQEQGAPSGPPLTFGEREALRVAVQQCWNVDVGSQAANIVVTISMNMTPDGKVVANSLRLIGSEGGSGGAVESAFQAARRAILRCQKGGYSLPSEKYSQWQTIEMTFNPEKMRLR